MEEPGGLQSMGLLRVQHDWATSLSLFTFMHWRSKWQSTPVFLPGESQDRGACWAPIYGVAQSQTWLKRLSSSSSRLQQYVNWELPDEQARFWRGRGTRDQIANIHWSVEKAREFQKNISFCFIDYAKAFDYVDHNKLENSQRDGNTRPPYCLLRNLYAGQDATDMELDMGQLTGSKWGKQYDEDVYCQPDFLTCMQSTSCKMLGWMNHKLESRLPGEIWTNIVYADDGRNHRNSNGRKQKETKEPLDEGERGEWKGWLKTQYEKTKNMASSPIT